MSISVTAKPIPCHATAPDEDMGCYKCVRDQCAFYSAFVDSSHAQGVFYKDEMYLADLAANVTIGSILEASERFEPVRNKTFSLKKLICVSLIS